MLKYGSAIGASALFTCFRRFRGSSLPHPPGRLPPRRPR